MPRREALSQSSAQALETGASPAPAPLRMAAGPAGEAGSSDALLKLNAAVAELKALSVQPLLHRAVAALQADDYRTGGDLAIKALQQDERNGFGWYLLAIARERVGDFESSVSAYEAALALLPDHAEVANDLGRLAYRLGLKEVAEKLFRHFLARHPDNVEGANNLGCALRDQMRFEEAIEVLRTALTAAPEAPLLWNTLGTVVGEQGDFANARIFFEETLRLEPSFAKARYNYGNAHLALGEAAAALEACEGALALTTAEDERQMMLLARSTIKITLGRIAEGWDDYEARLHPQFADVTLFMVDRPRWAPGADLAGKTLLVVGEQGLGDEVLFANVLPDVIERLGPDGRLILAVERRLVPLFQRSFPDAEVGAHQTVMSGGRTVRLLPFLEDAQGVDLWTPVASLLREFRPTVESYPSRARFLAADPARVAHWRKVLDAAGPGPKVGLLWKSAVKNDARHRFFSPFEAWRPVLQQPGIRFVNLQYGDCAEELALAKSRFGVEIWDLPGIDLKQDLDEVTALCCALDLTVGFANATLNLGAAAGAPSWLISTPGAWPRLGTGRYPWYPQMRVFVAPQFGAWDAVMAEVAEALAGFATQER